MKTLNYFFALIVISTICFLLGKYITDKTGFDALFGAGWLGCGIMMLYKKLQDDEN